MKTRIIIDSSANLEAQHRAEMTVLPLTVRFGEEEFVDGITITNEEFYQRLEMVEELPTTSQVTPDAFIKAFEEVKEAGDEAVVITVAAGLSGTCQSANIAAKEFDNIYVVDSGNVAVGSGVLAEYAYRLRDEGKSAKEIKEILDSVKNKVHIIAMVDTLKYLKWEAESPVQLRWQEAFCISNPLWKCMMERSIRLPKHRVQEKGIRY